MQTILQTLFNLNNTSYWHPLIWIFGAGIVLYKMPQKTELLGGRLVQRWYWFTAILLVLPYILWAGCRTSFIDRLWDNYEHKHRYIKKETRVFLLNM